MASSPVLNPDIPYVGEVEGGLFPGKMVKVQGKIPPQAVRFAINYQLGPNINPRDDIAIHVSPRFPEGFVTRNHIESMSWGREENEGPLWLVPGEEFEIIILCEQPCYKIAINGRHFTEFAHRLPYKKVTHLVIDGDVEVASIRYESGTPAAPQSPSAPIVPDVPAADFGPPGPGGLYPTLKNQDPMGPQGGGYQPPGNYGSHPDAYGGPGGYNPPRAYGYQPGYEKPEEEDAFGGCMDKVGLALGGLVAAGGVAAAMHAMNKKKEQEQDHEKSDASKTQSEREGGFGGFDMASIGSALASTLASGGLQGDNRSYPGSGYPPHDSNSGGGGVLGSILGALGSGGGGGGGGYQPSYAPQQSGGGDPLGGALSSILGGVLGGGGAGRNQQPSYQPGYQPGYQPSGGYNYQQSGGYPSNQGSDGSNLLSGIGSAIGSSLFNSALDGLSKHGKDKPQGYNNQPQGPVNYGMQNDSPSPRPASGPAGPPSSGGGSKLTAAEISRGLGLGDDED
ncbi:spidroin-2-like [Neodiprion fabricii]|uniref:spidroin-2-like n=1 Tax=Neodiprion fabricii TaxID=2872261 RepID=UPI001ED90EB2|nr:spidroin-2-like [Neodiprion fabricii]